MRGNFLYRLTVFYIRLYARLLLKFDTCYRP